MDAADADEQDNEGTHELLAPRDEAEDEESGGLIETLEECTRQLEALCGQLGVDVECDDDDGTAADVTDENECGEEDSDEQFDTQQYSMIEMTDECMYLLASLEATRLEQNEENASADGLVGETDEASDVIIGGDGSRDLDCQSVDGKSLPATPMNLELLDEMATLANDLSALTSLMMVANDCYPEVSGNESVKDESPSSLLRPRAPESTECNSNVVVGTEQERTQDSPISTALSPSTEETQPGSEPTNATPAARSTVTRPKFREQHTSSNSATRRSKREKVRPHKSLHKQVHEILKNPTFWKEYQSKSFQQHIKRQQRARRQVEFESRMAEKAATAHFRRAKYELRHGKPPSPKRLTSHTRSCFQKTYLMQFHQDRQQPQQLTTSKQPQSQNHVPTQHDDDMDKTEVGLLCGVYLYGNRGVGMAYFTCTSLMQLKERICLRFSLLSVLNLYREQHGLPQSSRHGKKRHTRSSTKVFQRLTIFDNVHDGDRICATQNAYEDMAILCDWMKQRQRHMYHIQPQHEEKEGDAPVRSPSTFRYSDTKIVNRSIRVCPSFAADVDDREKLWDANGRNVAVKKQLSV
uniref:Uncharacterized protein n=1 Tax=Globisporangium ultimum (strain ATCC 200006 / CBS 805.95 / DAOM BR144) TaxID=431595 RepID=K3WM94_GLOUD